MDDVMCGQSDDDGLDLEEVVNSAFRHLREDLTRRSPTATVSRTPLQPSNSDVIRHVTVTSSPANSVKVSKLTQSGATSNLTTKPAAHSADTSSTVVKAHSGKYFCQLLD